MTETTPDDPRRAAARAHLAAGTAETEDALQALIVLMRGRYLLPDGSSTRSLPRALGAWLDAVTPRRGGARPGAGRPPGARAGTRRTLLLSPEAIAVLDAVPERSRGAYASEAIVRSAAT